MADNVVRGGALVDADERRPAGGGRAAAGRGGRGRAAAGGDRAADRRRQGVGRDGAGAGGVRCGRRSRCRRRTSTAAGWEWVPGVGGDGAVGHLGLTVVDDEPVSATVPAGGGSHPITGSSAHRLASRRGSSHPLLTAQLFEPPHTPHSARARAPRRPPAPRRPRAAPPAPAPGRRRRRGRRPRRSCRRRSGGAGRRAGRSGSRGRRGRARRGRGRRAARGRRRPSAARRPGTVPWTRSSTSSAVAWRAERPQGAVDREALRRHAQAVGAEGGADLVVGAGGIFGFPNC